MSLILEALRKSEAERRRAQVPDLLTEAQAAAPVAVRAPPRWPWLAGSAVVVLAAAWFVTTRDATTPPQAESETASDIGAAADTRVVDTGNGDAGAAATRAPARPTSARPAPALQRPLVLAAPAPATPTVAPTSPPATRDATRTATDTVASTPASLPAPPPRPAPIAAAPTPAPAAAPAYVERVTDLGNADRKQLPPLKLTMHMWNDVVAQRFVIIDGARLSVGDRIGAVVVADIVPDGVVLDWNGRALKLPLR